MVARMKLRVKQEAKRRFKEILSEGRNGLGRELLIGYIKLIATR